MTRERIEDFREIVLPFLSRTLLKTNYENMGKSDAEEFEKDFNEILDLAIKALEQEPLIVPIAEIKFDENKLKELVNKAVLTVTPQEPVLNKIRDQLKSNLRGVEITLEVLVENDPLRPKMEGAKSTLEDCLELIEKAETEAEDGNA